MDFSGGQYSFPWADYLPHSISSPRGVNGVMAPWSLYELHVHLYITCLYMCVLVIVCVIHRERESMSIIPFRPNLTLLNHHQIFPIELTLKVCPVNVVSAHLELEVLSMDHSFPS